MFKSLIKGKIFVCNLSLFDGGAGAGTSGATGGTSGSTSGGNGTGTGSATATGQATAQQQREAEINAKIPWGNLKNPPKKHSSNQGVANPNTGSNQNVADSNQNGSNQNFANSTTTDNQTERWNSLIQGEFKDQYHNAVKEAIDKRSANLHQQLNTVNQQNEEMQAVIDAIRIRYPDSTDMQSLLTAINNDDSLIEQMAFDNGLNAEEYRNQYRETRQHEADMQELEQLRQEKVLREQNNVLYTQIPQVQEKYGNFDMNAEMNNPAFVRVLAMQQMDGGQPNLLEAFEFVHRNEIQQMQIQQTANQVNRNFTENQIANRYLPTPGGQTERTPKQQSGLSKNKYEEAKRIMRNGGSASHLFR